MAKYTFNPRDYLKFMPYDATDRGAGRRHICPICGQKVWSTWGNADKHWQRHSKCECGCGKPTKPGSRFLAGHNSRVAHPMRGRKHTKESKQKMSKVKKSRVEKNRESQPEGPLCACGCGGRAKFGNKFIYLHHCQVRKPLSEEHKKAIGRGSRRAWADPNTKLGSKEHKEKLSQALLGREITWKDKLRKAQTGKTLSIETRQKQSLSRGGNGDLRYTKRSRPGWKRYRRAIRKRDNYTCQECGAVWQKGERNFDVHHINYDLNDLRPENLITLCHPCHGKTNVDRDYYQGRYTELLKARVFC